MPSSKRVAHQVKRNGGPSGTRASAPEADTKGAALASVWLSNAAKEERELKEKQTELLGTLKRIETDSQKPTNAWNSVACELLNINAEIDPIKQSQPVRPTTDKDQLAKFEERVKALGASANRLSDDNALALIEALNFCARRRVQMPDWLCAQIAARTRRVLDHPVSLHDAFELDHALPCKGGMPEKRRLQRRQVEDLLLLVEYIEVAEKLTRPAAIKVALSATPQLRLTARAVGTIANEIALGLDSSSRKPGAKHKNT